MHSTLFANQPITGEENIGNYSKQRLKDMAATIAGIDGAAFANCLDSNQHEQRVAEIRREGEARGVQSTPTFFVNNQPFTGGRDANDFRALFAQIAPEIKFE
jgi:protein-disulfide isomerase